MKQKKPCAYPMEFTLYIIKDRFWHLIGLKTAVLRIGCTPLYTSPRTYACAGDIYKHFSKKMSISLRPEIWTFLFSMEYCWISDWCVVGFVGMVYYNVYFYDSKYIILSIYNLLVYAIHTYKHTYTNRCPKYLVVLTAFLYIAVLGWHLRFTAAFTWTLVALGAFICVRNDIYCCGLGKKRRQRMVIEEHSITCGQWCIIQS